MSEMIGLPALKKILSDSLRTPTADNSQHWKFAWTKTKLNIFLDQDRSKSKLDIGRNGVMLSLGCLLESLSIAASNSSFSIRCSLQDLTNPSPTRPLAAVYFEASSVKQDELFSALDLRFTDRRMYLGGELKTETLSSIAEDGLRFFDSNVKFSTTDLAIRNYIQTAETFPLSNTPVMKDILRWIRFTDAEAHSTKDGMPAASLAIKYHELTAMRVLRSYPNLVPLLKSFGVVKQHYRSVGKLLDSSCGLFCVSVNQLKPTALVDAGRLMMRTWLRLNQIGFGVQPITLPSLYIYNSHFPELIKSLSTDWSEFFSKGEKTFRSTFSLLPQEVPVWLIRTGLTSAVTDKSRTLRRELDELLVTEN